MKQMSRQLTKDVYTSRPVTLTSHKHLLIVHLPLTSIIHGSMSSKKL